MEESEILALFTADTNYTENLLAKPFMVDNKLCSSSGHAFVAVHNSDLNLEYNELDEKKYQTLKDLISEAEETNTFTNFEKISSLPLTDESILTCEECGGNGEVEFFNGHTHYEMKCGSCDGRGSFVSRHTLPIGTFLYQTKYLRKAMEVADKFSIGDRGILFFYGEGLIGGIMPTTHKGINLSGKGQIPL